MAPVTRIVTAFRPWVDQRHRPWPVLMSLFFVLGLVPSLGIRTVEGHGRMTEPIPRAGDHLKGDLRGWPIAGVPPRLTRSACLDIPVNKQFTEVRPGPLRLQFLFGDGANHVGLCQAFLLDPKNPVQKVKIGERMDCARSDHPGPGRKGQTIAGHMMVTIPTTVPCDSPHCVLQWVWTATHMSITRPEYYDDCVDLKIIGVHHTTVTAASPTGPQRREGQGPGAPLLPAPPVAGPPMLATGEDAVRQLITYAIADGGGGNAEAILTVKRQIEALPLNRHIEPQAHKRARAANERGLHAFREGSMAEAVQAFQAAYQLAPTDVEIVNNFGYAYLRHHDPEAAEPWFLLALVLAPGRVNAWVNLGQAYAKQGKRSMAVACLANGYRFAKNPAATRQFLHKLAEDEDHEVREAARQTLQLPLVQAGKD